MTHVYSSKVDTWLAAVLVVAALAVILVSWRAVTAPLPGKWLMVVPMLLLGVGLPVWLVASTTYTVGPDTLLVRSGPFKWQVPLKDITAVIPTHNPLSSPALSLDRLRIDYGRNRSIMISPRDKEGFIRQLRARGVAAV